MTDEPISSEHYEAIRQLYGQTMYFRAALHLPGVAGGARSSCIAARRFVNDGA